MFFLCSKKEAFVKENYRPASLLSHMSKVLRDFYITELTVL